MNVIPCPDLAEATTFFTEKLGFRLDVIMPADSPRMAVVSRDGLELRLEQQGAEHPPEGTLPLSRPIICRENDSQWIAGRAGMEYRDLIPGRLGGRVIASHIRLRSGGDVPDYVHYHKIGFQMIYCKAGAIRVVYENQGEPFWLLPGDCVLQPPEIRHRVLEAEAGSEVIEVGCPSNHETWVDHEMTLPTTEVRPGRNFGGQSFVRHVAESANWEPTNEGTELCDTGIYSATGGLADVKVIRTNVGAVKFTGHDYSSGSVEFYCVLRGQLDLEIKGEEKKGLSPGESCTVSPGVEHSFTAQANTEFLLVSMSDRLMAAPGRTPFSQT